MKPPPRARTRPVRCLETDAAPQRAGKRARPWRLAERKNLLKALNSPGKTAAGQADLDYSYLEKCVPTRSASEIKSMVEDLKKQVIANATSQLRKTTQEERKTWKPIEEWTHLAAAATGSLEKTISTAFQQLLIVSSTEPCSLRNCDPPRVVGRPSARTVQPAPRSAIQAQRCNSLTARPLPVRTPTPTPTPGPAPRPPTPSRVVRVPAPSPAPTCWPGAPPQPAPPSASPAADHATPTPEGSTTLHGPGRPAASTTSTTASGSCTPQPSSAVLPSCSAGSSSKGSTEDTAWTFGVDFEKIYCYLSTIQNPSDDYKLTPMESAVVLDLLMSLPEELPLLDCNGLHRHLTKVKECFSAPTHSKRAKQMYEELKAGAPTASSQRSPAHNAAASQPQGEAVMEAPPLNPFMVPLKLLQRR